MSPGSIECPGWPRRHTAMFRALDTSVTIFVADTVHPVQVDT